MIFKCYLDLEIIADNWCKTSLEGGSPSCVDVGHSLHFEVTGLYFQCTWVPKSPYRNTLGFFCCKVACSTYSSASQTFKIHISKAILLSSWL
jgi:hypothetical protein